MTKKIVSVLVFIAVLVFASGFGLSKSETSQILSILGIDPAKKVLHEKTELDTVTSYTVTRVIDGDTIEVNGGVTVRYIGVDTPESVDPRKTVECFAKEAAEANKKLVLGKKVVLEKDVSESDKYGRLLRYVYVDGVMINKTLVERGFAQARSYPPDIKHQEDLRELEVKARFGKKGLWGSCS